MSMKVHFFVVFLGTALFLHGCGDSLTDSRYTLRLPPLPEAWETTLGRAHWRIEWLDEGGRQQRAVIQGGGAEISLGATWVSPVSAMPFWPERGIQAGVFRPAGAIFPYDAAGDTLYLSWQGGVDANLYWEMAVISGGAGEEDGSPETEAAARAAVQRLPYHFNWPRFRRLFDDESLNAEIRADPWLADWGGIAAKIVQSGFDKRRLVPEQRGTMQVPVGPGPWIGTSPFPAPLVFEGTPVFPVRPAVDTWVSQEGLLHCNSEAWVLMNVYPQSNRLCGQTISP